MLCSRVPICIEISSVLLTIVNVAFVEITSVFCYTVILQLPWLLSALHSRGPVSFADVSSASVLLSRVPIFIDVFSFLLSITEVFCVEITSVFCYTIIFICVGYYLFAGIYNASFNCGCCFVEVASVFCSRVLSLKFPLSSIIEVVEVTSVLHSRVMCSFVNFFLVLLPAFMASLVQVASVF